MNVLVAFGTKYGSTEKVAMEIASLMRQAGHLSEVVDLRCNNDIAIDHYDLLVIGSGIAYGSWSKGAQRFLEKNAPAMERKKVFLFACCGDLMFDPTKVDEYRQKYLTAVAERYGLRPMDTVLFGGVLDFSKYGFLVKGILSAKSAGKKYLEQKGIDPNVPYDFRDWKAIRNWGIQLSGGK